MATSPVTNLTPEVQSGIRSFQHGIIKSALLLCAVPALILAIAGLKPEARGLALGGLFAAAEFRLSGILAVRRFSKGKRSGAFVSSFLRFALLAAPIIAAIKMSAISLLATVLGIFSIKAMIYFRYVVKRGEGLTNTPMLK